MLHCLQHRRLSVNGMNPLDLKYECLRCHAQWGNTTAGDNDISHGICKKCLRELQKEKVWKRQRGEGFSDCYAKGYDDCTEYRCSFWTSCLDEVILAWERENINGQGKNTTHI